MSSLVIGVLKCEGELASFSNEQKPASGPVRKLIDDLTVAEDREWGVEAVEPEVVTDGDAVFDIRINGNSVGYFALRTFAMVYGLILPELLTHGPESIVDDVLDKYDHQVFIIPLFGEVVNEPSRSDG